MAKKNKIKVGDRVIIVIPGAKKKKKPLSYFHDFYNGKIVNIGNDPLNSKLKTYDIEWKFYIKDHKKHFRVCTSSAMRMEMDTRWLYYKMRMELLH